ncbi:MAG: hypothetical protein LBH21_02595 [Gracilibacteraceae bacterium]|jgi:GNAT superfamily N-acetyltransferase|nr:hypothetical protein [Gracilibacteraceae bacterium]
MMKNKADAPLDIRFARPDEAGALIGLLRRQHGRLYPRKEFYDEGFIAEAIAQRQLRFAAAIAGGEPVGMICAAVQAGAFPVLGFSLLTVLPAYRGRGLGGRMQDFLDARLPLARSSYACMYCLTLDTVSQDDAVKRGYTPVGLLPNRYFFDPAAANLAGTVPPLKRTHLLMCKAFARRHAGALFPPRELADFTAAVFEALAVTFTAPAAGRREAAASVSRIAHSEEHRYCEIWIERAGGDLPDLLNFLRRWDGAAEQTYCVRLNMADAACPAAAAVLRRQGYICTGLDPLAAAGAYLLFHRPAFDRSGLALHPSFLALAAKLKDVN